MKLLFCLLSVIFSSTLGHYCDFWITSTPQLRSHHLCFPRNECTPTEEVFLVGENEFSVYRREEREERKGEECYISSEWDVRTLRIKGDESENKKFCYSETDNKIFWQSAETSAETTIFVSPSTFQALLPLSHQNCPISSSPLLSFSPINNSSPSHNGESGREQESEGVRDRDGEQIKGEKREKEIDEENAPRRKLYLWQFLFGYDYYTHNFQMIMIFFFIIVLIAIFFCVIFPIWLGDVEEGRREERSRSKRRRRRPRSYSSSSSELSRSRNYHQNLIYAYPTIPPSPYPLQQQFYAVSAPPMKGPYHPGIY